MATINISNFTNLNGFAQYGGRQWVTSNGAISVTDGTGYGTLYYTSAMPDLNGTLSASYVGLDGTDEGRYNGVLLRYINETSFISVRINGQIPGNYDAQGVSIGRNTFDCNSVIAVPLYNIYGDLVSSESYPYVTRIPLDGTVTVKVHDNHVYDISIYTTSHVFVCSGSWTDTAANRDVNGYTGFYHCKGWNRGWQTADSGWSSLFWNPSQQAMSAPSIVSFTANPQSIIQGGSSTICWYVTSGYDPSTVVKFNGVTVGQSACSAVSPSTSATYTLSAWNSIGRTSAQVKLDVAQHLPIITYLSASPNPVSITSAGSVVAYWKTNYSNVYIIDWGVGYATSGYSTSGVITDSKPLSGLTQSTTIKLSAYGPNIGTPAVSAYSLFVAQLPSITQFNADTAVCSGSPFNLSWSLGSYVTSAYIDHGVGQVAIPIGSTTLSAGSTTQYVISAYNVTKDMTLGYALQQVYIYPPVAKLSAVFNGSVAPNNTTILLPTVDNNNIKLDSTGSTDPDGQVVSFAYYDNGSYITSGVSLNEITIPVTSGTHNYLVWTSDPCGNRVSANTNITATYNIYPVAIISNPNTTIISPTSITLDGSHSYTSLSANGVSINKYEWFTGPNLSNPIGGNTSTLTQNFTGAGLYRYQLKVTDTQNKTALSNIFILTYNQNSEGLSAIPGTYGPYCVAQDSSVPSITFDGTHSTGNISSYQWNLSSLSAGVQSGSIITVTNVPIGSYDVQLTVTGNTGIQDTANAHVDVKLKPHSSAVYRYNGVDYNSNTITIDCPNVTASITLSAMCDNVLSDDVVYTWQKTTPIYNGIQTVIRWMVIGNEPVLHTNISRQKTHNGTYYTPTYRCLVSRADLPSCNSYSNILTPHLIYKSDSLTINTFNVYPTSVNYDEHTATIEPVDVSWAVTGSSHVYITVNGTTSESAAIGDTYAILDGSQSILISAVSGNCIQTRSIPVIVNDSVSACKLKVEYISLYPPEIVRYSQDRFINLTNFNPDFKDRDINEVVKKFEYYLNTMFSGDNGIMPVITSVVTSSTPIYSEFSASTSAFNMYEVD